MNIQQNSNHHPLRFSPPTYEDFNSDEIPDEPVDRFEPAEEAEDPGMSSLFKLGIAVALGGTAIGVLQAATGAGLGALGQMVGSVVGGVAIMTYANGLSG